MPSRDTLPLALAGLAGSRAKAGRLDEEVIALFDEHRDRLLQYLLSFGLPLADGEEIVQDVFLALFLHLRQGKAETHLRGWLFRVAHNLALKRRYRNRQDVGVTVYNAADPSPGPEEEFATGQTRDRLQSVVQALPEQDRQCLHLRAEGMRYREIAEILGMSLGSVSLSLTRSLARIARVAER